MTEARWLRGLLVGVLGATLLGAPAAMAHSGDPHGAGAPSGNTLDGTIRPGGPGFGDLSVGSGEPHRTRGRLARAQPGRAGRRRSLLFLAHLTDPHIVDEMSPARLDFFDPAGGPLRSVWRPQEALGTFVWDRAVRATNRNRTSRVRQGNGSRNRLDLAILTGDLVDNVQLNEARWYIDVLEGRRIDPFSGQPLGAGNPCPQADGQQAQRLNDDVANRRYSGIQDFDDYPGVPPDRYTGFWDPDVQQTSGPYAGLPVYPGLMDRAQRRFDAEGLRMPWYTARGNHEGLLQGSGPPTAMIRAIATGCLKVYPGESIDPASLAGLDLSDLFGRLTDPAFLAQLLASGRLAPPDPDRRFVGHAEFKSLHGPEDRNHGFGYVGRSERRASRGAASYYAFTPRRGVRLVSIDTVAEGGLAEGNVDDPQYEWLERELGRSAGRGELVIVYGHHTLGSMTNRLSDERAPACTETREPGCDEDPRRSTPLHRGAVGRENLRDLFLRFPNVIAYLNGHTHVNAIDAYRRRGGGSGFYQLNTAALIDPPQQLRTVELMDNGDGTLSLFSTVVDHDSPARPPAPGSTSLNDADLASLSRALSFADPQARPPRERGGVNDRNVELVLRDPRGR